MRKKQNVEQPEHQAPILKRQDFEKRFRNYRPAKNLLRRNPVTDEQMEMFFLIADEFRRDSLNLPAEGENESALLDDAGNSEALMAGVMTRLKETQEFIARFVNPEQPRTATLAEFATSQITPLQQRVEQEFEFENRRIGAQRKHI